MIVINESTNIILKPINEETNEITISSYDKEGNQHSTTIVCSGAETWETIHIPYENIDMSKSTMVEINSDAIKRYKEWVSKLNKELKVVYELPMSNNTKITYEEEYICIDNDLYILKTDMDKLVEEMVNPKQIIYKPKNKTNHNWNKDKFWK